MGIGVVRGAFRKEREDLKLERLEKMERNEKDGKKKKSNQFLDLNAPRRTHEDFHSYCLGEDSLSDHRVNEEDLKTLSFLWFPVL